MIDIRSGDYGEIDVINAILDELKFKTGHIVEIGAWDGVLHSNINHLIKNGWSATLIEKDEEKFRKLEENMEQYDVRCVCDCVSLEPHHSINDFIENDFDIFSLDIDGIDYWVWRDLQFRPPVVIIEYNSNWEEEISVPYNPKHVWDGSQYFGASGSAFHRLGTKLGYDLVGFVKYRNLFFVRSDINTLPVIDDLSVLLQYPHHRELTKAQRMRLVYDPHLRRLHLGCGSVHLPGFINIDMQYGPCVDRTDDIRYLSPKNYPPNSADLIYVSHVLEHFNRWEQESILRRWYDILDVGGVLRLAVPDFEALVHEYTENHVLSDIRGLLYGGQNFKGNYHHWIWDFESLKSDLYKIGFREVRKWDWRETTHAHIDDLSQAYLPHMDKENGRLVSLNVEGIK